MSATSQGYKQILVATDFSSFADAALKQAAWLARKCGATLTLAHTVQHYRQPAHASSGPHVELMMGLLSSELQSQESIEFESQEAVDCRKHVKTVDCQVPIGGVDYQGRTFGSTQGCRGSNRFFRCQQESGETGNVGG